MLQACLDNKVISDFLNLYDQSRWGKLVPSLLEIAILNLNSSFHTSIFSEEDIHNIIRELKLKLKKPIKYNKKPYQNIGNIEKIISYSPFSELKTSYRLNTSDNFKNNRYNHSFKNNELMNRNNKGKLRKCFGTDKKDYYNNLNFNDNKLAKSYNQKERINYAISYDKNLNPELIERTTFKKNKKERKKIIQKMTQEEYEQKYLEENQDNNEKDYTENEKEIIYKNKGQKRNDINYKIIKMKQFNNVNNKNINNKKFNKKGNNLYHYINSNINPNINNNFSQILNNNINNNNINNDINNNINNNNDNNINRNFIKKNNKSRTNRSSNYQNNNNIDKIANSQKGFENQYFKNQKKINNRINNNNNIIISENNNYINNENNSNEFQNNNKKKKYNGLKNGNIHLKSKETNFNDNNKINELIEIERKYKNKIDDLEKHILNNDNKDNLIRNKNNLHNNNNNNNNNNYNNNNINNYTFNKNNLTDFADKLNVNIVNMEDYKKKKGINNNIDNIINTNNNNYKEGNHNLEINLINNGNNIEEENNENEDEENINNNDENYLSDYKMDEEDKLSQMSNMPEKDKILFKKAMDEYPSSDDDGNY